MVFTNFGRFKVGKVSDKDPAFTEGFKMDTFYKWNETIKWKIETKKVYIRLESVQIYSGTVLNVITKKLIIDFPSKYQI